MPTTSDDVKRIVYGHIGSVGERAVRESLTSSHGEAFLADAASSCLPLVRPLGAAGECALVTVLLHYALSAAGVPSHRKVSVRGVDVDIVVPDARTLGSSPHSAMVICVPEASGPADAAHAVAAVSAAQPIKRNIAVAMCPTARGLDCESYSVEDGTFGGIVRRTREFLAASGGGRLGVIGSPADAK